MLLAQEKFSHPERTAKGEERATVTLRELKTLWLNSGTQCNLSCENCYIESSPQNDRLAYLTLEDVTPYLDEISELNLGTQLIGITGGEPFLNPGIVGILNEILARGLQCLVLTNAHHLINRHKDALLACQVKYGANLMLRVSLDHFSPEVHERQRGSGTFRSALQNIKWLYDQGFAVSVAGRSLGEESRDTAVAGYQALMDEMEIGLNVEDPSHFVIFPEMQSKKDVPEITVACWDILGKSPDDQMCASERMIVKRKGEEPSVLACTLLAYDPQFELGSTLKEAGKTVPLNHRFCAEFCVLGGASCSSTAK